MPTSSPFPLKKPNTPWSMCSAKEGRERTRHKELSVFECIPHTQQPDPCLCVQKYRRSAAGGGVVTDASQSRTLDKLENSVDYLLGYIFPHQRNSKKVKRNPLCTTVNFMHDRIRAIQVDLTTLLGHGGDFGAETWRKVRSIEAKLIRYNILSQYLLSDLDDKKVQWKFMNTALRTSVSSYFATWDCVYHCASDEEIAVRDEIISYTALLHISTVLRRRETAVSPPSSSDAWCGIVCEDGEGMSALLGLHRRYIEAELIDGKPTDDRVLMKRYPKWLWVLTVASAVETGDYFKLLRLLTSEDILCDTKGLDNLSAADKEAKLKLPLDDQSRWKIIARCCMAQILPVIRIGLTRIYNKSFGKGEKVSGKDLSHLLHLPNAESAIQFCKVIGLPTSSSNGCAHDQVIMKQGLISITADDNIKKITNPGRDEDAFVFGPYASLYLENEEIDTSADLKELENMASSPLGLLLKLENGKGTEGIAKAQSCLDEEDSDDSFEFMEEDEEEQCWGSFRPRIDTDSVKILPSPIMWELVG